MDIDLACQYYDICYKSFEDNSSNIEGWSRQESLATWQSEKLELALTSGESTLSALQTARTHIEDYMQVLNGHSTDTKDDAQKWLSVLDEEESQINAKIAELRELKEKRVHDKGQRL
jgi:hypothetical protein